MELRLETGRTGEEIASRYLEGKGYSILERNWYDRPREVDIIASNARELIIVEVKVRSSGSRLRARETIDRDKRRCLIQAADRYIRLHGLCLPVRYDIIAIDIAADQTYTIEHIPNAFYPTLELRPRRSRRRR